MTDTRTVFLCAGGTGGHLFPAQALAQELALRGYQPHLLTDGRGKRFATEFPGPVHEIASETLRGRNPIAIARTLFAIGRGYAQTVGLIRQLRPVVMAGFGGYPSLPPMLAGTARGVPTLIHEQNGVMGKANRILAKRVGLVAAAFPRPLLTPEGVEVVLTGNPVRDKVVEAAEKPYPGEEGDISLLVFGGSQGARILSETVPAALGALDEGLRARLRVCQQVQEADLEAVKADYDAQGIRAELAPFFADLPQRIANAHLVICRAGASTVAELSAIGRPAVLVPLKVSLEGDQAANARVLGEAGGAAILPERDLRDGALAPLLNGLFADRQRLTLMAEKARGQGRLNAASTLADLAINLSSKTS